MLNAGLFAAAGVWALPVRRARACEVYASNLRVGHPWTRATDAEATSAVLCMRIDEVSAADRLIAVRTPVATAAEMAEGKGPGREIDLPIAVGQTVEMHEAGVHLRLTGLLQPLQVGREYPLHIEFEQAGLVLARLNVDFVSLRFT